MFPPGLRFVAQHIGLPGFRDGQRWGADAGTDPTTAATPAAPLKPAPPPSAILDASNAVIAARLAAERQRKRAAGGTPTMTTQPVGPKAILQPKTLVGA